MEDIIMNEIIQNIISVVVTAVILPLISYAGTRLISYLDSKIKNEKAKDLLTKTTTVVTNAVRAVFQTYVDSLKQSGEVGKEAQIETLNQTKNIALTQLSEDVKEYIKSKFGDINTWLKTQIEATINLIKN